MSKAATISHHYDASSDLVYISIDGTVNGTDISKTLVQIANDYKDQSELYVISDYSKGNIEADPTYFLLNLNAVKEIFMQHFSPFKKFCNAYVLDTEEVSSTRVLLDQFRKVSAELQSFHSAYFKDAESAKEWINEMRKV